MWEHHLRPLMKTLKWLKHADPGTVISGANGGFHCDTYVKSVRACVPVQREEGEEEKPAGSSSPRSLSAPLLQQPELQLLSLHTHQVLYGRLLQKLLRRLQLIPVCGQRREEGAG